MKLQLVMLTTVISMITERRVEAQLKCHENRNASGNMFYITSSSKNLTEKIPNGKRLGACSVSPYHIVIFYSEENYFGEVNTVYSSNVEVYRPRSRFIPKSVLIIGTRSSRPTGLFLFRHKNYEAGLYKNFIRDDRNVQGAGSFQSAIIIGTEDWKVVRKCKSGECWSCLEAPKDDGASFIQDLKVGFVTEDTIQAYKENCINIKLTALSSIPDCPCNQFGVVDGPDKCKGDINGKCPCSANFTGDACDSCSNSAHTYREGKCVGCGCYKKGAQNTKCNDQGHCHCKPSFNGKHCNVTDNGEIKIGNMRPGERKHIKATCVGKCNVKKLSANFSGYLDMHGSESSLLTHVTGCFDQSCFCIGDLPDSDREHCRMRTQTSSNTVYITLYTYRPTKNVIFSYEIGTLWSINLYEPVLDIVGLQVMKIGDVAKGQLKDYTVLCNGACNVEVYYFTFDHGGYVYLAANKRPWDDIYYGYCAVVGMKSPTHCPFHYKISKNYSHIFAEGYRSAKNVYVHYKIPNLVSVSPTKRGG